MNDFNNKLYKGNLDEGEYYVEHKDGSQSTLFLINDEHCKKSVRAKHLKILAPVPSYEEYEQLENWNRFTADYHALREAKEIAEYEKVELLEQMKLLKELLKECREVILDYNHWIMSANPNDSELILRINEVLNA